MGAQDPPLLRQGRPGPQGQVQGPGHSGLNKSSELYAPWAHGNRNRHGAGLAPRDTGSSKLVQIEQPFLCRKMSTSSPCLLSSCPATSMQPVSREQWHGSRQEQREARPCGGSSALRELSPGQALAERSCWGRLVWARPLRLPLLPLSPASAYMAFALPQSPLRF